MLSSSHIPADARCETTNAAKPTGGPDLRSSVSYIACNCTVSLGLLRPGFPWFPASARTIADFPGWASVVFSLVGPEYPTWQLVRNRHP